MRLRKCIRFFFPRRLHPLLDAAVCSEPADERYGRCYEAECSSAGNVADPFIAARYLEGRRWREVIKKILPAKPSTIRALDVGAGNGAIELAFTAGGYRLFSVDTLWNESARRLHREAKAPFRRVVADVGFLPFQRQTFDLVLCLETIEHFKEARSASSEMKRVLRSSGLVLLTTPARWRFALRADPHFGIRGLALLPRRLQQWVARKRGFTQADHFVDRLYSSVPAVIKIFGNPEEVTVLSRSRAPRRYFWDAIVIRKARNDTQ